MDRQLTTEAGIELHNLLVEMVKKNKSQGKVYKANKLMSEVSVGFTSEEMFVSGARRLLGIPAPKLADDDEKDVVLESEKCEDELFRRPKTRKRKR